MKHFDDDEAFSGQGHCVSGDFSAVGSTSDLALRLWKADTITGQIMDLCPCHPKHTHTLLPPMAMCRKKPLKMTHLLGTRLIAKHSRKDTLKQFCPC